MRPCLSSILLASCSCNQQLRENSRLITSSRARANKGKPSSASSAQRGWVYEKGMRARTLRTAPGRNARVRICSGDRGPWCRRLRAHSSAAGFLPWLHGLAIRLTWHSFIINTSPYGSFTEHSSQGGEKTKQNPFLSSSQTAGIKQLASCLVWQTSGARAWTNTVMWEPSCPPEASCPEGAGAATLECHIL